MTDADAKRVVLCVDRDGWTGGLQLSINVVDENNVGFGYRIAGPKFNGSSEELISHVVTERDADEIRAALDKVGQEAES